MQGFSFSHSPVECPSGIYAFRFKLLQGFLSLMLVEDPSSYCQTPPPFLSLVLWFEYSLVVCVSPGPLLLVFVLLDPPLDPSIERLLMEVEGFL